MYIQFKGQERPAKTNCVVSKLLTVLVSGESPTTHNVSQFWIFGKFHKSDCTVEEPAHRT